MSFKREFLPAHWSEGEILTADMNGIGFLFRGPVNTDAPIEETLVAASMEGILRREGRVMALLTDWISVHSSKINADRLTSIINALKSKEMHPIQIYWCATAERLRQDPRFERLRKLYRGVRIDYLALLENDASKTDPGTELLIKKNGEDPRFSSTCLRIPNLVLRHRLRDIMTAQELTKHHLGYRYRVMFGPTYRADVWTLLRKNPNMAVSELARRAHCVYNTAKLIKLDYELVKRDYSKRIRAA